MASRNLRKNSKSIAITSTRRHRAEKLRVVLRLIEPLDEELHRLHRRERVEDLAEDPHAVQLLLLEEQLFLARTRAVEVDGRENAAVDELPVEVDLHVAGPLNSSKITSSIREPVSMRAVAMIV